MRYRFTANYRSDAGAWQAGEEVDVDAQTAAWLLRDVPGIIEPVEAEPAEEPGERAIEKPQQTRQMTRAPRKRSA